MNGTDFPNFKIKSITRNSNSISLEDINLFLFGFVLPGLIFISLLENLLALIILLVLKNGIGSTTKILFIILAFSDVENLVSYYGFNYFAIDGLKILTHGKFYFRFVWENFFACKFVRGIAFFTVHNINWLYVLINAERFVAVFFPHSSKHLFNMRKCLAYVLFMVIIGAIFSIYFGSLYTIQPKTVGVCVTDIQKHNHWLFSRLLYTWDAFLGPNVLALALALINFARIRNRLLRTRSRSRAVNGALAAVLMACIHVLFQFPSGALNISFYIVTSEPGKYSSYISNLLEWYKLSVVVSIIGSLADFFIYTFIYRAFRLQAVSILKHPFNLRKWKPGQRYRPSVLAEIKSTTRSNQITI